MAVPNRDAGHCWTSGTGKNSDEMAGDTGAALGAEPTVMPSGDT